MPIDMEELDYMIRTILRKYAQENNCPPWPKDIIDQTFLVIEQSKYVYLRQYLRLIGPDKQHKQTVNQQIGKLVKEITGLKVLRESVKSKSDSIVDHYSELG